VLTWDPAGEAHRDGPISQPGVVKALVAAGTVFELFASMCLRIRSDKLVHVIIHHASC